MNSNYKKVFSGNSGDVQLVVSKLHDIGIEAIVKDERESGRLAGFGSVFLDDIQLFVHMDEVNKAEKVIAEFSAR